MNYMGFCLVALGGLLALTPCAGADTYTVTGTLTGDQETPPNFITPATGSFSGLLDVAGPTATLAFTVSYSGLIGGDVVAAAFHDAPPGSAGPDVRDYDPAFFSSPDGSFSGAWTSSDAQPLSPALVSELLTGDIYFDIATQQFPEGEIRGQLTAVPAAVPEIDPGSLGPAFTLLLGAVAILRIRRAGKPAA